MHRPRWSPSFVPRDDDQNVYLVLDEPGSHGRVWREAYAETTDLETVIADLLGGQYKTPVRVVSINTGERWSEDVSADVALELRRRTTRSSVTFRSFYKTSSTVTKADTATFNCRSRYVWSEHGVPAEATTRRVSRLSTTYLTPSSNAS